MKSNAFLNFLLASSRSLGSRQPACGRTLVPGLFLNLLLGGTPLLAQDSGTWTADAPGNWSDPLNWAGGTVASGPGATADFSTVNITGDHVVTLDAPYTIGTLIAQDLDSTSNSWIFDGPGVLTLNSGTAAQPLINVLNRFPVISAPLAGTNGLSKTGQGVLALTGDNSALSGTLAVLDLAATNNNGVVLASDTAIGSMTTIDIQGTGTTSGGYLALSGGVTLGSGVSITLGSQGGSSAPAGGLRSEGTGTEINTVEGPINVTLNLARIANNTAGRLDITGAITGGANSIMFRFAKNEGIYITNPLNSWSGETIHSEETLWFAPGALPTTSNLRLCSSGPGTVQTSGLFDRDLGSGANQVQFALNAGRAQGFGARGGDLTLDFSGAGATVLFDTNTGAPESRIRTSTLVLNGSTADGNITLVNPLDINGANRTIQVGAMTATLQGGVMGGTFGLAKTGTGTLNIVGPLTYTGATTLAAGTLQTSAGDDSLPPTTLAFTGTAGTLDLTTTSQSLAALTVPNGLAASYTILGNSLTLDGTADRQFGPGGTVTSAHSITLDLSGLSSFTSTSPANNFRVGMKSGAQNTGTLGNVATMILADQNVITASSLRVGDVSANNHGGTSTLLLGRVNSLYVGTINTGSSVRSNTNLLFDPVRANPSVTIRNTDGTSPVTDWRVGNVATFNATIWTDSVDFWNGTVDALVNSVTVGTADIGNSTGRGGTENASFTMGAGTVEVATLTLGRISGSAASTITSTMAANGTFTLDHPAGTLKAGTLTLAENTTLAGGTASRRVSGTLNLVSGTLEATTIQLGPQTGNATASAALNWMDGTIRNLTASGLALNTVPLSLLTGSHVFDATGSATITVDAASSVSGPGGITKTGTGTVSLQGANTYTGPTDVQAGTLAIANSFPGDSAFTVSPGATLALDGVTLQGPSVLDIDGTLDLTGPVTIILPPGTVPGSFPNLLRYGSITGAGNLTTNYRNVGFSVGASATDLNVAAGIPLTWTGAGGSAWDVGTTASWKDASNNPETFFWADSVTFDSAGSGSPNVSLTAEMQPAAVTVNEAAVDYLFSGPGFISGPTGLTKDGAAKLTIDTSNTNTGITTVHAGTLEIGSGGTTGWMGGGDIVNDGALVFNRSGDITVANGISGTGSLTKLGAGVMTVTADNGYAGGTTIGDGTLQVGQQSTTGSLGAGAIVNDGLLRLNRADGANPYAYTFANDISGTGGVIVGQNGAGSAYDSVLTLTGNNSFGGNVTVASGGLKIAHAAALGTGPKTISVNNGSNGRPQLYLDGSGGNITLPADFSLRTSSTNTSQPAIGNLAGDNVVDGTITLTSGGGDTAVMVLGGTLVLNGQITTSAPSIRYLRLGGTDGTSGTLTGKLTDGNTTLGINMLGPNTWTLTSSASDYTGPTTVNGGTLLVNGTQNLATGNVTVNNGTLGGTGTIGGNITVNAGGILAPGTSVGTLTTVNSVVLDGTLVIEISGAEADRLDVGGTLDITNATVDFDELTAASGSPIIIASYGALAGTEFAATIDPLPGYAIDYNYNSLKQIALVSVAGDYNAWAAGFGLNPLTDGAPTFDKDNDGLTNSREYAFGLDPTRGSSVSPITAPLERTTGTFKYTRRLKSLTGLNYGYESSTTLDGGWPAFTPVSEVSSGGSPVEEITVTVPASLLTSDKRFVRVLAE